MSDQPQFLDTQEVFDKAILEGRLSDNPESPKYAGHYMYMGTWNRDNKPLDTFKHRDTRVYID